ncbi:MAG: hypothetical protein AABN34_28085 [Acidobacteriota bacterium]
MPTRNDLQSRLAAVSVGLEANTRYEHDALVELEKLLVRSRIDEPAALTPRELSIERASLFAPGNLPNDRRLRLSRLVETVPAEEEPQFRVFRREAPMAAPMLDLAAPSWGRGALAEHSIGPLRGIDGRLFWFDFFSIIRLVPLYFAGDPLPAMLFFERTHLSILDRITHRHTLVKSSLWIRANLLAVGAPAGGYVGLRVEGGKLHFSVNPANVGGKLTMPAGSTCKVELNVSPSQAAAAAPGQAGLDAAEAVLDTPDTFSFDLKAGQATLVNLGRAALKVYDVQMHFEWERTAAPSFEPLLQSIVIPMKAAENRFRAHALKSPFAEVTGKARIQRSGWTLPVSIIDINNPTEAAGSGGLAIQTGKGLTLSWRGLREGPIQLRKPWIAGGPGLIVIIDAEASNIYAHQRFLLWNDADSKFRSQMDLRYTDSFRVTYASAATGSEMVLAQTDVDARIDRPVDVKGTPFPIRTLKSLVSLVYSDDRQFVFVYDDNILVDSLDPLAKWPVEPGKTISLAIRNALFTITPVNSVLLFAELKDEETVKQATLMLGMGLYGLLPTLPDPYAANVTWLRAATRLQQREARPSMLLVAAVAWTKAADDDDPDAVSTSFMFAPLGPQQQTFGAWDEAGRQQRELNAALSNIDAAQPEAVTQPNAPFDASFIGRQSNQRDWDRNFAVFENEQFALLDVSTNADQMGVSFAWFNEQRISDSDLIFYKVYKPVASGEQPAFPLQVQELDLSAQSRYVRAFTAPQISWEPVYNLTPPPNPYLRDDPPGGWNLYPNDGGPTRLFNDSVKLVPIAPIPVTEFLVKDFKDRQGGFTGALFTLPFGLRAFAKFSPFEPGAEPARLGLLRPEYKYEGGDVKGALQLRVDAPKHEAKSPTFAGGTFQLNNVLNEGGNPTYTTTLGFSVTKIFNKQFYYDSPALKKSGVPLSRIDFCGYGANIFSHWEDPSGAIAAASKAYFDVFSGRTAQEVIQVRSLLYPWGVRVVRTITLTRASDAYVFRFDTGWQAETEGIYDFRYKVFDSAYQPLNRDNPYEFHPGLVKGVFNVRNIKETNSVAPFPAKMNKTTEYLDSEGIAHPVVSTTDKKLTNLDVFLQPVYFDADVAIDFVVSGAVNGRVPSKGMLGYVQLAPRGEPIPPDLFIELLMRQFGSLGGPVDCVIDIGKSGQKMRLSRVDVNASTTGASPLFVSAARGAMVLSKDGAWSVVEHNQGTGEVSPLDPQAAVPVIRRGKLSPDAKSTDTTAADLMRIANPVDLQVSGANTRNYGLLHSTNTQKVLFRLPKFELTVNELKSAAPNFADAYRLVNTKGIFPKVQDTEELNLGAFKTKILPEGYKLLNEANRAEIFQHPMKNVPLFLVNEKSVKIYVSYENIDKDGGSLGPGMLKYGFDATAGAAAKQWLSKLNDIAMVVDLGTIPRLLTIKGKFDTEKGSEPAFRDPELLFTDELQPMIDILQVLASIQSGDYKTAFGKGLDIAMTNSADSWTYGLNARLEIPLVRFPPGIAYNAPQNPLKLEAHMALGVYFNEALAIPSAPGQLVPSAGAFLEFGGSMSVMCVTVEGATVFAVGTVDLRTAADIKTGPSLHMRFGFGAEIAVGLPVIGPVSVLYMVGVEIDLDSSGLVVAAFLLYRGRAELLQGLVTVQIQIEAKGSVKKRENDKTELAAQITFGLDISLFLVINLHFSKSWEESRQIA